MLELIRLFAHPPLAGMTLLFTGLCIVYNQVIYKNPDILFVFSVMFFTHLGIYPLGWLFPKVWKGIFGRCSVNVMCLLVTLQKCSFVVILRPYLMFPNIIYFTSNIWLIRISYIMALGFIIFGTWLQNWVYRKLGRDGVYYGFKFGKTIPWVSDFPFDTFRHPQYTGAYSIFVGVCIILGPSIPVLLFLVAQAWGYVFTSYMESSSDQDTDVVAKKMEDTKKTE